MRFTSLVVELIRARPRLVVWIVVLIQAALWLLLPMLLYRSPPGDLATARVLDLTTGHERVLRSGIHWPGAGAACAASFSPDGLTGM